MAASDVDALYDDAAARATLRFLVSVAAQQTGRILVGGKSVGKGYLYRLDDEKPMGAADVEEVRGALAKLMEGDHAIDASDMEHADACAVFEAQKMHLSLALLRSRVTGSVRVHTTCDGKTKFVRLALCGQALLPRTSSLSRCPPHLSLLDGALLVSYGGAAGGEVSQPAAKRARGPSSGGAAAPPAGVVSKSLLGASRGLSAWDSSLGVRGVGALNGLKASAASRELHDFMLHAEFRQEGLLADLAAQIARRCDEGGARRVGVVCIAGPTSSGKTTFATKLTMYLRNLGLTGVALTVDHYYLPLDRQPKYQPRKQRSDVDYDAIESMDAQLVNEHINALLDGKRVLTPVYNMKTGYRDGDGTPLELPAPVEKSLLVIEGIHALNPDFLKSVPAGRIFKVYISPLSALQLDETNALKTTDNRLLRRMCRDYNFRGHSASRTLSMWANVRNGEGKWIFPFQDDVDFVMNSSHEYEMAVLKPLVEPLLCGVPPSDPQYGKARALLELLALFNPASTAKVPTTSLLREFIGDGAFDCH